MVKDRRDVKGQKGSEGDFVMVAENESSFEEQVGLGELVLLDDLPVLRHPGERRGVS